MPSLSFLNKRRHLLFPMTLALCAAFAPPALAENADMHKAVEAWRSGDELAAVRLWMPLAERGNADAQFNLGQAFKLGRGVAQDIAAAELWYRRAAQQGHLQAEDNLGLVLFASGQRVGAMHYIRRSAARGEARALFLLGTAHFNGDLADRDWPRAYALIQRASETGLSLAASRIAKLDLLIPEDQRKQGLALMPRLLAEEQAARAAVKSTTASATAAPAPEAAPAVPSMISMAPSDMNANLDKAQLIEPEMAAPPRPKAGVTFTAPSLPATPVAPIAPIAPIVEASAELATPKVAPTAAPEAAEAEPASAPTMPAPAAASPLPQPPSTPRLIELPPSTSAPAAPIAPAEKPKAQARKPATGPWRLQLGAFSQPENAQRLWTQLGAKHPEIARRRPIVSTSGRFTMLYAGHFTTRNEASDLCTKLKNADQACLILD